MTYYFRWVNQAKSSFVLGFFLRDLINDPARRFSCMVIASLSEHLRQYTESTMESLEEVSHNLLLAPSSPDHLCNASG